MTTAASHATRRLAVLVDADNVPPHVLDAVMETAWSHGSVVAACAYRHWTPQARKSWDAACGKHGLQQVDQAPGPNATDIALAIDAVDLVLQRGLDVVCVVSGDRDFAPLAARLRRSRLASVLMADPAKVKDSNRALWDTFVPLEVTRKAARPVTAEAATTKPAAVKPAAARLVASKPSATSAQRDLVAAIVSKLNDPGLTTDGDGWVILNEIGKGIPDALKKPQLSKAIDAAKKAGAADAIEIDQRPGRGTAGATVWIRLRRGGS